MVPLSTDPTRSLKRWAALIGFALGLFVLTCTGLYMYGQHRKIERLEAKSAAAVANEAAAEAYSKGTRIIIEQREEAKDATDQVLNRNPDYRDAPVPGDVADRMRKHPSP